MSTESTSPVVVALVSDMIFESKICGTGRAAGVTVVTTRTPESLLTTVAESGAVLVLMDLSVAGEQTTETIASLRRICPNARITGFAPHVDAERLQQARDAGADDAMPRSRFDASLGALLSTCVAAQES